MLLRILCRGLAPPPVLANVGYSKYFILIIDASGDGLGVVLYQEQIGGEHVVTYANRGLRAGECTYFAHKLDFLTLKWAVCDKFYGKFYGKRDKMDNNLQWYVLTTA